MMRRATGQVAGRTGAAGFTLIELMVAVSILGIFTAIAVPMAIQTQRLVESEIALQKALQALRSEVEVLRQTPAERLAAGETMPFAEAVSGLDELVSGRGEVTVEQAGGRPGLLKLRVAVYWDDARTGPSSVHTVMYRNAGGKSP